MGKFLYKSLVALCFCIIANNQPVYSKEYIILHNEESLDRQFERIMAEVDNLPILEPVTIRIDEGYYNINQTIIIQNVKHPLKICGEKNKTPIISGSIEITGWEVTKEGLWRSKIPDIYDKGYFPDQLFVNGKRAIRACTPNNEAFSQNGGVKDSLRVFNKENIDEIPIIEDGDLSLLTSFKYWMSSKFFLDERNNLNNKDFLNKLASGNGFLIENTKSGIDIPREWCTDRNGYIYYMPEEDARIENTEFRVPIIEKLLLIKTNKEGCSISFENIIFEHTSFQIPSEGVVFGQAASEMSAAIEADDVHHLSFEECEIRNTANYGLWLREGCTHSMVKNSYLHDLGAGGIKIGTLNVTSNKKLTRNVLIENNIVLNYGVLAESAVGVALFNASNCSINHNDIHFGNYTGISLGWVWGYGHSPSKNNEVAYNRISHIGTGRLNDLGGIYTLGKSEGTLIHHNVIFDVTSGDYRGWGIYADEGTTGVLFDNNLAYRCTSGGFHLHYGSENVVRNNIFAWGEKSQITFTSSKGENPVTFKHNIIIMDKGTLFSGGAINSEKFLIGDNCYWSISSELPKAGDYDVLKWIEKKDKSSIYQDPLFRNPEKNNFRFKKKSICKLIGFEPFDYSKAGAFGRWKRKLQRDFYFLE